MAVYLIKRERKWYIYLLMEVHNAISKTGVIKIKPEFDKKKNVDQLTENTGLDYHAKQYQQNLDRDALQDKWPAFINKKNCKEKD